MGVGVGVVGVGVVGLRLVALEHTHNIIEQRLMLLRVI